MPSPPSTCASRCGNAQLTVGDGGTAVCSFVQGGLAFLNVVCGFGEVRELFCGQTFESRAHVGPHRVDLCVLSEGVKWSKSVVAECAVSLRK
jgi:hypothetical protein